MALLRALLDLCLLSIFCLARAARPPLPTSPLAPRAHHVGPRRLFCPSASVSSPAKNRFNTHRFVSAQFNEFYPKGSDTNFPALGGAFFRRSPPDRMLFNIGSQLRALPAARCCNHVRSFRRVATSYFSERRFLGEAWVNTTQQQSVQACLMPCAPAPKDTSPRARRV
jgi:hypothetical protein